MNAERWQQVDEVFDAALDLGPGARPSFLAAKCSDDEDLRREVEALLAAHGQAGDFIETSAIKIAARAAAGETVFAKIKQQVGPYKIISLLGAGGMGEVYLAEDARLNRRVALKILPLHFVADPERVKRFEREARAASALNHPNIITIYDIGRAGDTHYIATEYVGGQTLRARLRAGRAAPKESLDVASQVAAALSAAHQAGIIHRDVKPENIMLRPDGLVKVLDFGLAKLLEPARVSVETVSLVGETQSGLVMGTISYMSPEQALGEAVDGRTDIWSLGVVLYEMVAGRKPYAGASHAAVFDAILNHPPAPVTDFGADFPDGLNDIVNRALEKDRELRHQTAADLRADLRRLQRELEPAPPRRNEAFSRLRRRPADARRRGLKVALAACAVMLLAFSAWAFLLGAKPAAKVAGPDWSRARSNQLTNQAGPEYSPHLAPDGKSFLYASRAAGNWDIYWQRVGGRNVVNLTKDSPADDMQPAYSPDGNYIAFRSERQPEGVYVMEATSENVRRVSDFGFHPSWSPDGKELVVSVGNFFVPTTRGLIPSALWIINVATGAKRQLTEGDAVQPCWSPHGQRIAYWGLQPGSGQRDLWTISAGGGPPMPVTNDAAVDWNPVWSPDGRYLYFASNRGGSMNFWRVPVDEQSGQVLGAPESVITPSAYSQHLSFARDGKRMAYVQKAETLNLQRIAFDPISGKTTGTAEPVTQGTRYVTNPDLSPDGEWFVSSSQGERQEDIFLIKKDGTEQRQLTNDNFNDRSPRWSPDGNRIAFYSDRSGRFEVWSINTDGTGVRQLTFTSGPITVHPIWSPDGNHLLFKQREHQPFLIEVNKLWSEQTPQKLPTIEGRGEDFWVSSWSSDGRRLAGSWVVKTARKGYLHTYDFATQSYENLGILGSGPTWLSDNRRLLFQDQDRIYLLDSQTKKARELLSAPPYAINSVCPTRDSRTLYYTLQKTEADVWLLNLEEQRE